MNRFQFDCKWQILGYTGAVSGESREGMSNCGESNREKKMKEKTNWEKAIEILWDRVFQHQFQTYKASPYSDCGGGGGGAFEARANFKNILWQLKLSPQNLATLPKCLLGIFRHLFHVITIFDVAMATSF